MDQLRTLPEHRDDPSTDVPSADEPAARSYGDLESMLRGERLLSDEALTRALLVARDSGERLDAVITRLGLINEQALVSALSRTSGLAVAAGDSFPVEPVAGPPLSVAFLRDMRCVPIALAGREVVVAVASPYDTFAAPALEFAFGVPVTRRLGRASDIDVAIERLYTATAAVAGLSDNVDDDDLERLRDLVSDAPAIRAVNRIIARAVDERASDIHVEPTDDSLAIRFRIDGVLRDLPQLPAAMRAPLVSRIKILAGLNIAEKRLPQDGRMRIAVRGHEIDLRVATAPSIHGESVVMRILDRSQLALDFASLGFDDALAARFGEAIRRPHGIVLVTGPTGSGKTTTLYAALAALNRPERKLLTAEDPIEYRLPGIVQAQVNPAIGFTFSAALRSFLRQDPDIIMVGEIRDADTAEMAVQAALTGHMILSTLHTNTAAGAASRLLDMGVEPFLLSSVLTGVLAQRLVRRLCAACREPYAPADALRPTFEAANVALPDQLFRPGGCQQCSGSGYSGRVAVFELLIVDDEIARLILTRPDARAIAAAAQTAGGGSLLADGLGKAAAGLTSVEEVLRIMTGD